MCRTLAAWQEVSRVGMFLEICLQCKGIILERFGCLIYSCVLRPSVVSAVSDAVSFLHCLCISLREHRFTQRWCNPVLALHTCQMSLFLAVMRSLRSWHKNKQRSQSCTQNAGQHQFPIASANGIVSVQYQLRFSFPVSPPPKKTQLQKRLQSVLRDGETTTKNICGGRGKIVQKLCLPWEMPWQ